MRLSLLVRESCQGIMHTRLDPTSMRVAASPLLATEHEAQDMPASSRMVQLRPPMTFGCQAIVQSIQDAENVACTPVRLEAKPVETLCRLEHVTFQQGTPCGRVGHRFSRRRPRLAHEAALAKLLVE